MKCSNFLKRRPRSQNSCRVEIYEGHFKLISSAMEEKNILEGCIMHVALLKCGEVHQAVDPLPPPSRDVQSSHDPS
jgi:hypothetical protein